MKPTNELRWLERTHRQPYEDHWNIRLDAVGNQVTERVWTTSTLQQKWVDETCVLHVYQHGNGPLQREYLHAWRDVEVVKEPKQ